MSDRFWTAISTGCREVLTSTMVTLTILKICGLITIPWLVVSSPVWIILVIALVLYLLYEVVKDLENSRGL